MIIKEIPIEEINFHSTSFCDRRGRLFWWQGELYRGITTEYASFYNKLFENGIVQRLTEQKFLGETKLTNLTLSGYSLVLKHQCLPFVSYANEWCPEMLRDCALLVSDLMIELAKDDLTLADICTFDILFDGCRPIFVDFCSIVAAGYGEDRSWRRFRDDFHTYFINPLKLISQGYGNLARWLLADYDHGILLECAALMDNRQSNFPAKFAPKNLLFIAQNLPYLKRLLAHKKFKLITSALLRLNSNEQLYRCDLVRQLRQELESIPLSATPGQRTEGDKGCYLPLSPSDGWTQKHFCVHKVLSDLRPPTVLDLGSHQGWFSQLAASLGSRVVALDMDENIVNICYREAIKKNLPILPLVMNIRDPSPGHGACNKLIAPAFQRLSCDMVLALSLVHLLAFNQHVTFEQMSETFALFSKKWLLVEFVSRTSREIRAERADWHPWYTLENFINALKKWFPSINIIASDIESSVLLLCEKQ